MMNEKPMEAEEENELIMHGLEISPVSKLESIDYNY